MDPITIPLIIAVIAGTYLAFNIGANDVANAMGTSVGSGALSIKNALIAAAIFEFLGAFLFGDEVSETIKQGFINPKLFASDPQGFSHGMTAAILATSLWLQYATMKGLPVSTTHSIVGAVLGFALFYVGIDDINFSQLTAIFSSWLISPILGGLISFIVLKFILSQIIDHLNPIGRAKMLVPFMMGIVVAILSSAFAERIIRKLFYRSLSGSGVVLACVFGLIALIVFMVLVTRSSDGGSPDREGLLDRTESIFAKMQLVTACFLAFAHGSNDVANAIGPAAAVIAALSNDSVQDEAAIPWWLFLIGGLGIVIGLSTFGRKVIHTVGQKITEITPSRGFAAEFGAALTILVGTLFGLPLSTTHVLVGAVIGVGFARGISGIDAQVIRRIARSWVITMPATAAISMTFCFILRFL